MEGLAAVLTLLGLLFLLLMIVGLVRPRWVKAGSRGRVMLLYGGGALLAFSVSGSVTTESESGAAVVFVIATLLVFVLYRAMRRDRRHSEAVAGEKASGPGFEIVVHTNPETERVRKLFRDATAASRADPEKAVTLFRKARGQAALAGIGQSIDVLLRLPRYLQKAAKSEEGWQEFNKLLKSRSSKTPEWERLWHLEQSTVYDKMRLFLQREKRFSSAVLFGVSSTIFYIKSVLTERPDDSCPQDLGAMGPSSDTRGGWTERIRLASEQGRREDRQRDLEQAKFLQHRNQLDRVLTELLLQADLLERHDEALAVLCEWANAQPNADDHEYEKRFNQALGLHPQLSGLNGRTQLSRC